MIISHVSHLLSVLVLYELSAVIFPLSKQRHVSIVTASLHIISPAGIFLSAPYAEAPFALLHFTGLYAYALSLKYQVQGNAGRRDLLIVASGLMFGIATTMRSNGILTGMIYCYDIIAILSRMRRLSDLLANLRQILVIVLASIIMALIAAYPQYLAYQTSCRSIESSRPWCLNMPPSIYAWVQSEYWYNDLLDPSLVDKLTDRSRGTGFLKYWTLSNIPLFILATPMLCIMTESAIRYLLLIPRNISQSGPSSAMAKSESNTASGPEALNQTVLKEMLLPRLSLPQLLLTVMVLTTYHVQIITRISSGYPVWYWWVASLSAPSNTGEGNGDINEKNDGDGALKWLKGFRLQNIIVRFMVIYALVQGALFASFLPPA